MWSLFSWCRLTCTVVHMSRSRTQKQTPTVANINGACSDIDKGTPLRDKLPIPLRELAVAGYCTGWTNYKRNWAVNILHQHMKTCGPGFSKGKELFSFVGIAHNFIVSVSTILTFIKLMWSPQIPVEGIATFDYELPTFIDHLRHFLTYTFLTYRRSVVRLWATNIWTFSKGVKLASFKN